MQQLVGKEAWSTVIYSRPHVENMKFKTNNEE
jgi:hypothetical protein